MQADEEGWRSLAHGEQLIPGIPDAITLDHVASKLPWRLFHILSLVSPAWLRAIRSHQVYDARVRSHATETLTLIHLGCSNAHNNIYLYSMRDNSCSQLPRIPNVTGGLPRNCQCVSLDGKIYVLGGRNERTRSTDWYTAEVYVFDLAGQRQWMECARMKKGREDFGCGVLDGKIYVFGGWSSSGPVSRSEIYDPKENIWSPISSMISLRYGHKVAGMGEELLVHSGQFYSQIGSLRYDPTENRVTDVGHDDSRDSITNCAGGFFEVYHPVKDEWRLVKSSGKLRQSFLAQGKLYCISRKEGIKVFDFTHSSWTHMHSVSFAPSTREEEFVFYVVHAVEDELLAIAYSKKSYRPSLFRSTRLGSQNKEIVFQQPEIYSPSGDLHLNFFHEAKHSGYSIFLDWMSDINL